MSIIFLDIDGVMNAKTDRSIAGTVPLLPRCVQELNSIIKRTNADLVISSSWRFFVTKKYMTLEGFLLVLTSHGVTRNARVIGALDHSRSKEDTINEYIRVELDESDKFVVLDDDELSCPRLVRCDPKCGLTPEISETVVDMLL